jgi:hypothetical protein
LSQVPFAAAARFDKLANCAVRDRRGPVPPVYPPRKAWWTAGSSDRYKHDQAAIDAAVKYVANQKRMVGIENMSSVRIEPACDSAR